MAMTAMCGTRLLATRRQSWCPGTARSRENANSILDAEVTEAVRQKNCATQQMARMNVPQLCPMAATQLDGTMYRSNTGSAGSARVTATSRMNPKTTEATTDMYMPTAAERDALCVSSADVRGCVEARDRVLGHQQAGQEDVPEDDAAERVRSSFAAPPGQVERLGEDEAERLVIVRDDERMTTITATPIMCQYAEIVLSIAVIVTLNRFSTSAASSTTYMRIVSS